MKIFSKKIILETKNFKNTTQIREIGAVSRLEL